MNLGNCLVTLATAPARVGLVAADAGLDVAATAVGLARRTIAEAGVQTGPNPVAHMLGIEDAVTRANRLASLLDDDAPLGRALAPDGPVDRLLRPGGVVDMLTAPDGLLDRLTAEGGVLERALKPGGLVDQLVADDGLIERVLREDGLADRLLAENGLIDKLTARYGPLEQLANVADTLSRMAPGMEALDSAIETLQDAVIALTMVVNPLSNIAERIPLPRRIPRRSSPRPARSQRIIDHD
jgi:hypothetical protein